MQQQLVNKLLANDWLIVDRPSSGLLSLFTQHKHSIIELPANTPNKILHKYKWF